MSFNDPNFANQRYLGPGGVNLTPLFEEYRGSGVRIGIVDTGILYTSAELRGQVDVAAGWNALTGSADAYNAGGDQHGTIVAEYLGARADNGVGGVGAAPGATLVGFKMETRSLRTASQELDLLQRQAQVDISHNSWSHSGESFRDNFLGAYAPHGAAIADAATNGRGGLGTVIIRSAGNNGADGDSVNAHNYQNNRFTMTVGATDSSGNVQGFSNKGAAVWAVAPGSATSWAAPLLSGTVALMLEANPGLGYRDVQAIIALTARSTDPGASWITNAAEGYANGGGFRSSTAAGFGMVDARAAVRLAETWEGPARTEANIHHLAAAGTSFAVPDVGSASSPVTISGPLLVERVLVTLGLVHDRIGDLRVSLISPGGTESMLLDRLGNGSHSGPGTLTFTLTSNQFLWEEASGTWALKVADAVAGRTAEIRSWSLDIYGTPATADDTYVFTDRFADLAGLEPSRRILSDTDGGVDGLNAAAVSTGSVIDLRPGGQSIIAGTTLTLAPGTVIENAWGGDGNDVIFGADAGGRLHGGRGDDRITGGSGKDTLEGGPGNDILIGGGGTDTASFAGPRGRFSLVPEPDGWLVVQDTTGALGTDRLFQIEYLAFSDMTIEAPQSIQPPPSPPSDNAPIAWLKGADSFAEPAGGAATVRWILDGHLHSGMTGKAGKDVFAFRPGDGPDWIAGFNPAEDHILLLGIPPEGVRAEAETLYGVSGTRLRYGAAEDWVFLAGVESLDPSRLLLGAVLPHLPSDIVLG